MSGLERSKRFQRGFSLIEMVVAIVITSVIALSMSQFIGLPVESYVAQARRGELVEIAEAALGRMVRDLQKALPNSIRVGCGGTCIEYLRVLDGGRYRAAPPGDDLSFNAADADTGFEVLGPLRNAGAVVSGGGPADCRNGSASCLVIYNTGFAGTNAYTGDNIATVTGVGGGPVSISFNNAGFSSGLAAFPAASPARRFYVVDSPVSYLCDPGSAEVRFYEGYNIRDNHSDVDSHGELIGLPNPAEDALLVDRVSGCQFSYTPGTPSRNGLVTLVLSVSMQGETVTLAQQAHVVNLP